MLGLSVVSSKSSPAGFFFSTSGLHSTHLDSYIIFLFLQFCFFSPACRHVTQFCLPHSWPFQGSVQDSRSFNLFPTPSTIFVLYPTLLAFVLVFHLLSLPQKGHSLSSTHSGLSSLLASWSLSIFYPFSVPDGWFYLTVLHLAHNHISFCLLTTHIFIFLL